jgi:hypothetical protein
MFIVLDVGRDRWRSVIGILAVNRLLMRGGELLEHLARNGERLSVNNVTGSFLQGHNLRFVTKAEGRPTEYLEARVLNHHYS